MSLDTESMVGLRIAEARSMINMSQKELAHRCNLSQVAVCKMETGQTLRSRYFPQIAKQLRVSVDWLLNGGEYPLGNAQGEDRTSLTEGWLALDKAISAILTATPDRLSEAAAELLNARNQFSETFTAC